PSAPVIAPPPTDPVGTKLSRLAASAAPAAGLAIWVLGSIVLASRLWVGQRRMRRLRASAVPAEPDAEALCRAIARRMDVDTPTVWRTPFLFSPCLDGLRRPAILLPDDVSED